MKVICFVCDKETGKSTLIKKILREKLGVKLMFLDKKFWSEKKWKEQDIGITCLYNNKKIGVFSHGDVSRVLNKWLEDAKKEGCQIVIFSCHNRQNKVFLDNIKKKFKKNLECFKCEWNKGWSNKRKNEENKKRFLDFEKYFDKIASE